MEGIHDFVRETFTYGESGSLHESLQTGKADCEYVEGLANNTDKYFIY